MGTKHNVQARGALVHTFFQVTINDVLFHKEHRYQEWRAFLISRMTRTITGMPEGL